MCGGRGNKLLVTEGWTHSSGVGGARGQAQSSPLNLMLNLSLAVVFAKHFFVGPPGRRNQVLFLHGKGLRSGVH
jgi:hypothetical protein